MLKIERCAVAIVAPVVAIVVPPGIVPAIAARRGRSGGRPDRNVHRVAAAAITIVATVRSDAANVDPHAAGLTDFRLDGRHRPHATIALRSGHRLLPGFEPALTPLLDALLASFAGFPRCCC